MTLYVDPRRGSSYLVPYLRRFGLPTKELRMVAGDVKLIGRGPEETQIKVGVEIKRMPSDLISSFITKRFQGVQLPRLLKRYDVVWLLIEGDWTTNPDGAILVRKTTSGRFRPPKHAIPFTWMDLVARLLTLTQKVNINLWWTRSPFETGLFLSTLYRWWTRKPWEAHRSHTGLYSKIPRATGLLKPSDFQCALARFPGLGEIRSEPAALFFGTMEKAVAATEKEWMQVPGISTVTARRVVRWIKENRGC